MRHFFALIAGGLFGIGLTISGMIDTAKVQGWLDVFGDWDPTLAFVMGGAIIPMAIAWQITKGRKPALGGDFPEPTDPFVSRNLVIGSTMFGMGWALVGLCPGPVFASITLNGTAGVTFLIAMVIGMMLAPPVKARLSTDPSVQPAE